MFVNKLHPVADFGVWGPLAVELKRALYYLFDEFINTIYKININAYT